MSILDVTFEHVAGLCFALILLMLLWNNFRRKGEQKRLEGIITRYAKNRSI